MATVIAIDEIKDGMVVSEPVINNYGITLITAGSVLSILNKRLLKTWNIRSVAIRSDDNDENFEINDELKELAEARLAARMSWFPRNQIEYNLYQTAVIHIAQNKLNIRKDE